MPGLLSPRFPAGERLPLAEVQQALLRGSGRTWGQGSAWGHSPSPLAPSPLCPPAFPPTCSPHMSLAAFLFSLDAGPLGGGRPALASALATPAPSLRRASPPGSLGAQIPRGAPISRAQYNPSVCSEPTGALSFFTPAASGIGLHWKLNLLIPRGLEAPEGGWRRKSSTTMQGWGGPREPGPSVMLSSSPGSPARILRPLPRRFSATKPLALLHPCSTLFCAEQEKKASCHPFDDLSLVTPPGQASPPGLGIRAPVLSTETS